MGAPFLPFVSHFLLKHFIKHSSSVSPPPHTSHPKVAAVAVLLGGKMPCLPPTQHHLIRVTGCGIPPDVVSGSVHLSGLFHSVCTFLCMCSLRIFSDGAQRRIYLFRGPQQSFTWEALLPRQLMIISLPPQHR